MRIAITLAAGALAASVAVQRAAAEPQSAAGFWVTRDHGAVVNIVPCDSGLCGYLVGVRRDHKPGDVPVDSHNPNPSKRQDPMCGLELMGSLKPVAGKPAKWESGWVYDPESGSTYTAQMQLDGPDLLKLRGYLGISLFGRTESWTRESGDDKNRCVKPPGG